MAKFKDLTGQEFDRLKVLRRDFSGTRTKWICVCKCNPEKEFSVFSNNLIRGHSRSCGCLNEEIVSKRAATHRMTHSSTYHSWQNMKARCYYPRNNRYQYYGAKGITVCDRWKDSFENFLEDMGEAPKGFSLERKDVTKNYCKENCKWASVQEQNNNKTTTILVDLNGEKVSLREACIKLELPYKTIYARIKKLNWTIDEALSGSPDYSKRAGLK